MEAQSTSAIGGWQLGDLDLSEHLDRYRGQRLVLIIAPIGEAEPATYTCGVCGFVMNEVRECPRCKLATEEAGKEGGERADILDQVRKLLMSRIRIQRSARKVGSKIGSLRPITGVP